LILLGTNTAENKMYPSPYQGEAGWGYPKQKIPAGRGSVLQP